MNSFAVNTILKLAMLSSVVFALSQTSAYANVVYDLTLIPPRSPSVSGTGAVVLKKPVPLTGSISAKQGGPVTSTSTDLVSLTFTLSDGDTFSTADETLSAPAFFFDEQLMNLRYHLYSTPALFAANYQSGVTDGKVLLIPTPEPGSVWLAIPGFALFFGLRLRKPR